MKHRILAAFIALLLVFAAIPHITAENASDWTVPEGYNEHDYNEAAAFLEQTDENGIKNGEKLSENYDVNNPETWEHLEVFDDGSQNHKYIEWECINGEMRLSAISLGNLSLCGNADFSCCDTLSLINLQYNNLIEIDLSSCYSLAEAFLSTNRQLSILNVSECPSLELLNCARSQISELDLTDKAALINLCILGTPLSEVDLSGCTSLEAFYGDMTPNLISLDFSNCNALIEINCQYSGVEHVLLPDSPDNLISVMLDWDPNLSELDLSGCTSLRSLVVFYNSLTSLDVTDCYNLRELYCDGNSIEELDVTACSLLEHLTFSGNMVGSIDLTNCPHLVQLHCGMNELSELDLSGNPQLPLENVSSAGDGTVGYYYEYTQFDEDFFIRNAFVYAQPNEGSEFLGWYNEDGELVTTDMEFDFSPIIGIEEVLIARFSGGSDPLPGDIDGSGEVSVSDAIMALRCAMGILELTPEQIAVGDMNESGVLEVSDAIIILRTAMGLI